MDKILITGSSGFLGSNLVRHWNDKAEFWHIIRRSTLLNDRLHNIKVKNILYWEDIISGKVDQSILPAFSACYHFAVAGNSPIKQDIDEMIKGNIFLFIKLMDFCKEIQVKKLIHFASWSEYGNHGKIKLTEDLPLKPDYLYGASKSAGYVLGRAYAQQIGLPLLTLRLFSLFGPYDKPYNIIPSLFKSILQGKPIQLTEGMQTRDFMEVNTLLSLLDCIQDDKILDSDVYNVCTGIPTTIREIGNLILNFTDSDPKFFKWGTKPYRQNEAMYIIGDPSKTQKRFKWKPKVNLELDLENVFNWYEGNMEWLEN